MKLDEKRILDYFSGKDCPENAKYIETIFSDLELEPELKEILERQWKGLAIKELPDEDFERLFKKISGELGHKEYGK